MRDTCVCTQAAQPLAPLPDLLGRGDHAPAPELEVMLQEMRAPEGPPGPARPSRPRSAASLPPQRPPPLNFSSNARPARLRQETYTTFLTSTRAAMGVYVASIRIPSAVAMISTNWPRETGTSLPLANVLSTSRTAAALLFTTVAASAPVNSANNSST